MNKPRLIMRNNEPLTRGKDCRLRDTMFDDCNYAVVRPGKPILYYISLAAAQRAHERNTGSHLFKKMGIFDE